jgi:predicted transcriptional regulator
MASPQVRRTIILPEETAAKVKGLARSTNKSEGRILVELIQSGLEAREAQRRAFVELTDRLGRTSDEQEQQRIKQELERMTFGDVTSNERKS